MDLVIGLFEGIFAVLFLAWLISKVYDFTEEHTQPRPPKPWEKEE